jgi:hypothetical protein
VLIKPSTRAAMSAVIGSLIVMPLNKYGSAINATVAIAQ